MLTSITSEKPQDYKADQLPEIELTSQPEENYVDLVARPLFIKGRRPVDEPVRETGQAAAKPETFDWQLTGVYSTKKTVSALFSRAKSKVAKDNHRKITVGEDLDGWKLIEINKDRAVLKQGSKEKELLLRKPKSKTPLPARMAQCRLRLLLLRLLLRPQHLNLNRHRRLHKTITETHLRVTND